MSEEEGLCRWVVKDRAGREMRSTQPFESRAAAEDWLGQSWTSLLQEGAVAVALLDSGGVVYEMSLLAESDD